MKNPLQIIVILLISIQCSYAQLEKFPIDNTTLKVTYEGVFSVDEVSKDELYDRAMGWATKRFVSTKAVVDYSDKGGGRIVLKPIIKAYCTYAGRTFEMGHWNLTFTILVKDGKYKYTVTDFEEIGIPEYKSLGAIETSANNVGSLFFPPNKKMYLEALDRLSTSMESTLQSLKVAMATKADTDF